MRAKPPSLSKVKKYVSEQLLQRQLFRGQQDYTPFIILGRYRVGSNLLVSSLFNHPEAVVFSELFIPGRIYWGNRIYGHADPYESGLLAEREKDSVAFLHNRVFRPYAKGIKAVGFKIFYTQLDHPEFASLRDYLLEQPIKVIHLRRNNLLNILISYGVSRQTGESLVTSQEQANQTGKSLQPFSLDASECQAFFEKVEDEQARYTQLFSQHDCLELAYEEIQQDFSAHMRQVQQFLGLTPKGLTQATAKQNTRRQEELLTNYSELKAYFQGTRWASFFV